MKIIKLSCSPPLISRRFSTGIAILFSLVLGSKAAQTGKIDIRPGVWKSSGAELLVIDQDRFQSYFLTSISCVAADSGAAADVVKLYPQIESWSSDQMVVSGYDWKDTYKRLAELPESCKKTTDINDPVYNFDVFWQYFHENYPAFKIRGIPWDTIYSTYRSRVKREMSEMELIAVLGEMVEKINDPHVFITNTKEGAENISFGSPDPHGLAAAVRSANPGQTTNEYRAAANKISDAIETGIRYELLGGNFKTAHNERLLWGMLTPDVAYLRSSLSVGLFPPGTDREQMYSKLDTTLDIIFTDFKNAKSLIIDVTENTGGATFIGDQIARRVIQKPTVAYHSKLQTPSGLKEPFTKTLEPAEGPRFTGPVVVLISSNTVSAGEYFPLVLGGLPNITLFGETTLGATSSFSMMKLPNGWRMSVPNYVVTDRNGNWYEAKGISPDIRAQVFNPKKIVSGYFDFVLSAVKFARSKTRKSNRENVPIIRSALTFPKY